MVVITFTLYIISGSDECIEACMQAICIAACYPENWPLLVICPSSMRLVWYDALLNWLPARLVPEDPRHLTVIANGKVRFTATSVLSQSAQLSAQPA